MAEQYATFDAYVDDISGRNIGSRMQFLQYVRFARIVRLPGTMTNPLDVLAIGCFMAWGWIDRSVSCPSCQSDFYLGVRQRRISADGTRNKAVVKYQIRTAG